MVTHAIKTQTDRLQLQDEKLLAQSDEIVSLKREIKVQAKRIKTLERKQKIQIQAKRSQAREIQNLLNLQDKKREKVQQEQQTGRTNPCGCKHFRLFYLTLKSTCNLILFLTNTTKMDIEVKMLWKDKVNTNDGLNREALDSKPKWSGIVFLSKTPKLPKVLVLYKETVALC